VGLRSHPPHKACSKYTNPVRRVLDVIACFYRPIGHARCQEHDIKNSTIVYFVFHRWDSLLTSNGSIDTIHWFSICNSYLMCRPFFAYIFATYKTKWLCYDAIDLKKRMMMMRYWWKKCYPECNHRFSRLCSVPVSKVALRCL
jgi:hypothetical protein